MIPPVRKWSREEMLKRVARFADLKGFSDGLQDSALPECHKTTYNVIGFQTPENAGDGAANSPVGKSASENAAIRISEGFNLGFVTCKPGKGVLMHNHDTTETFVVMSGRWRVEWNEGAEPEAEHMLLFVIGGNAPQNEFTPASMRRVEEFESAGR